jgi:hypothetical protein
MVRERGQPFGGHAFKRDALHRQALPPRERVNARHGK